LCPDRERAIWRDHLLPIRDKIMPELVRVADDSKNPESQREAARYLTKHYDDQDLRILSSVPEAARGGCHPGCFPAGTPVQTPYGPRPIKLIGRGDLITLLAPDATATKGTVVSVFQTCNRLVELRTESGSLLTTETQPFCLRDGGFRRAGELTKGDLIWQWNGTERRSARVVAVAPTGQKTPVFNLVIGQSAVFVAGGFLVRGKPPPDGTHTISGEE
jgi:hypothetical protein